jgi:hypothetical protein
VLGSFREATPLLRQIRKLPGKHDPTTFTEWFLDLDESATDNAA